MSFAFNRGGRVLKNFWGEEWQLFNSYHSQKKNLGLGARNSILGHFIHLWGPPPKKGLVTSPPQFYECARFRELEHQNMRKLTFGKNNFELFSSKLESLGCLKHCGDLVLTGPAGPLQHSKNKISLGKSCSHVSLTLVLEIKLAAILANMAAFW